MEAGPPPGWYQDPDQPGQRYWDGRAWTEHRSGTHQAPPPVQPPPVVPSYAQPHKKDGNGKWIALAVAGVIVIGVIASSSGSSDNSTDKTESSSSPAGKTSSKPSKKATARANANKDPEKPNNASDSYTPHVGPTKRITVDGIVYSVAATKSAKTIGDTTIGTAEQASGTYLIVTIKAHSTKGESVTLTDETFKVTYKGGPEYSADTDGTVAQTLEGGGDSQPFFLTDVQPDGDEKGQVVFDIPDAAAGRKLELRVNELGFGSTHGFIRLPQ
jgi:hypothetical protein